VTVRSARLAEGLSGPANGDKTVYTCPAGVTALVKDVRLTGRNATAVNYAFYVRSGGRYFYLLAGSLAANALASSQGFVVLEPGDQLGCSAGAADALSYWVSGAELEGIAP
jgi:hypothetical protein